MSLQSRRARRFQHVRQCPLGPTQRFEPRPGVVIQDRFVIVDDGQEIRSAVILPPTAMVTAVAQRIHSR